MTTQLPAQAEATLARLDFTPTTCVCMSEYHGHPGPMCEHPAQVEVRQHYFDECDPHPMLDDDGCIKMQLCGKCYLVCLHHTRRWLAQIKRMGRPWCITCQAPMTAITDVFRSERPL